MDVFVTLTFCVIFGLFFSETIRQQIKVLNQLILLKHISNITPIDVGELGEPMIDPCRVNEGNIGLIQ